MRGLQQVFDVCRHRRCQTAAPGSSRPLATAVCCVARSWRNSRVMVTLRPTAAPSRRPVVPGHAAANRRAQASPAQAGISFPQARGQQTHSADPSLRAVVPPCALAPACARSRFESPGNAPARGRRGLAWRAVTARRFQRQRARNEGKTRRRMRSPKGATGRDGRRVRGSA